MQRNGSVASTGSGRAAAITHAAASPAASLTRMPTPPPSPVAPRTPTSAPPSARWQLEPVEGSIDVARDNRRAWREAIAEGRQPDVPQPAARPVPTFEGGTIVFAVSQNKQRNGYEIATLFPQPPARDILSR